MRTGVGRLSRVLSAADMLGASSAPADLAVAQLPQIAGERWLALPFAGGIAPEGELAIVAHTSGTIDTTKPLAGIFCDGWSEVVPNREETTGVAFHFDAPNARAPQAIVLASDNMYLYENLDTHAPIAQTLDAASNLRTQDRMKSLASEPRLLVRNSAVAPEPVPGSRFYGAEFLKSAGLI